MQESKKLFSFAMKGSDEQKFVLDNFKQKNCGGVKIKDFFRKVFFPKISMKVLWQLKGLLKVGEVVTRLRLKQK